MGDTLFGNLNARVQGSVLGGVHPGFLARFQTALITTNAVTQANREAKHTIDEIVSMGYLSEER